MSRRLVAAAAARPLAWTILVAGALGSAAQATTDLPDPDPNPYASIGSAAALTPTHALAGADTRRWLGPDRFSYSIGAVLAWSRDVAGNPTGEPIAIVPANGVRGERFGASLVQGPSFLVVGSPGYKSGSLALSGRVRLLDDAFVPVVTIDPPTPRLSLGFGTSVATNGDRVVIGAPGWRDASGVPFVGAAFVYVETKSGWTVERLVTAPPPANTRFGSAVAIAGDTLVVGAPGGGSGTTGLDHGRVWLTDLVGDAPLVEVVAPIAEINDRFGAALAAQGDIVLVGAPGCACGVGRAFVGQLGPKGWTTLATLEPPDEPGWSGFGGSVSISGARIVVGTGGISEVDGVYGHRLAVFRRTGNTWSLETAIEEPEGDPSLGVAAVDAAGVFGAVPFGGPTLGGAMRYDELERLADLNGDGVVNPIDLGILLGAWGPTDGVEPADLNGNGNVGPEDLGTLLGGWTR